MVHGTELCITNVVNVAQSFLNNGAGSHRRKNKIPTGKDLFY